MLTKKEPKSGSKNDKNQANHEGCCTPPAKAPNQLPAITAPLQTAKKQTETASEKKECVKTRITVKFDVGFSNHLSIRGKGCNLTWDKGQPLKNIKSDEWVWETDTSFTQCEFKVLINDRIYENGENHILACGAALIYTPHFY